MFLKGFTVMTDLIYFDVPMMWLIPLFAALLSVLSALLGKVKILPWICAALHGIAIAAIIYLDGGLTDIFLMLIISLIASSVCTSFVNKGGKKQ